LPVPLGPPQPLDRAISTVGGIRAEGLTEGLMLRALPGVFAAGEMLDWDAPTGGYLLTACLATGLHAGRAAARFLTERGQVDGAGLHITVASAADLPPGMAARWPGKAAPLA